MLKLMRLELQRMNLRTYWMSSVIGGIVLLLFTYFVAYVAQAEQEMQFYHYETIFQFTSSISIIFFGILSAAMYSRLIIREYSGKRLVLLFSYPVSRQKILTAKIVTVFSFVLLSMLFSTAIPMAIFAATESLAPIVPDTMTFGVLAAAFRMEVVSLAAVNAIGLIAMRIGFIQKSVPATLISAFVLSGLYGTVAIQSGGNDTACLIIMGASLIAVVAVIINLSNKINHMEVV